MTVWAGLIVSRVLHLADTLVPTGAAADVLLAATPGPRLEVAEALGQAAAAQGMQIPFADDHLRMFLAARNAGTPVDLTARGIVVGLADGRLGLTVGRGRVVESHGAGLTVVITPEPGRYVEAFAVPGLALLGGAS
ncbi:hypothetical protein SEA_HIRKO_21 [Arthrobacter phage Hirko]|nr:hypothetical protein SEA_HIRKO_21 [Arthrobacter phage Hirko]